MADFTTVKEYLQELRLSVVREDAAEGLVVVEDEDRGIKNLFVDYEDPILIVEQMIMPVPDKPGELFRRLLQMNRTLVHGAFTLDEEGQRVPGGRAVAEQVGESHPGRLGRVQRLDDPNDRRVNRLGV